MLWLTSTTIGQELCTGAQSPPPRFIGPHGPRTHWESRDSSTKNRSTGLSAEEPDIYILATGKHATIIRALTASRESSPCIAIPPATPTPEAPRRRALLPRAGAVIRSRPHSPSTLSGASRLGAGPLLLALFLAGCGGGGGGGGDAPEPSGFTVTGTIEPQALSHADRDTNDPETPSEPRNNTRATAQPLRNPGVVGGFVAAPGTDTDFGSAGDEWDIFVAELEVGQQIVLQHPDPAAAELGLYLQGDTGILEDAAPAVGVRGELTTQASGTYHIGVRAHSGQSSYLLRIEPASTTLGLRHQPRAPRLSDPILPGELIVETESRAATATPGVPRVSSGDTVTLRAPETGMRILRGAPGREQLWEIPAGHEQTTLGALNITPLDTRRKPFTWASAEQEARHDTLLTLAGMRHQPGVLRVAPNLVMRSQRLPNDPLQGLQWFHENVELPLAWDTTTGDTDGAPVVVGVIDTGVFLEHEDLQGQLVPGYDVVSDPERSNDGDGIDPDPDDPGDSTLPARSSWHGTHVAGTVAAATHNAIGVAGASWEARIMPVRALGLDGGTTYDVMQGVRYAAGLPNDTGTLPDLPADIINLSIGGGVFTEAEAALYREVRERGILILAASGNSGTPPVTFPAAYDDVLAVGATGPLDRRAPYSSYGSRLDLVAPGGDTRFDRTGDGFNDGIYSTFVDDTTGSRQSDYEFLQGTSMATAVASGVLALGRAMNPDLDLATARFLLEQGDLTTDLGPPGHDEETGWGLIDAPMTVSAAASAAGRPLPPLLSVSPAALDFGFTVNDAGLDLRNAGGGTLAVTEITGPDWLSISPEDVDASGLGLYRIRLLRERLEPGPHSGTIRVSRDSGATLELPVTIQISAHDPARDSVGRLYVHLIDGDGDRVATRGIDPEEGVYIYRFEDVAAGEYRVIASTDMNDDRLLCGPMEACGAYRDLGSPATIDVQGNRTDLDFAAAFFHSGGLPEPNPLP